MSYYEFEDQNGRRRQQTPKTSVSFDELNKPQRESYDQLVEDAAYYLYHGILTLEECTPARLLDDNEEPTESLDERFQDDVLAYYKQEIGESEGDEQ